MFIQAPVSEFTSFQNIEVWNFVIMLAILSGALLLAGALRRMIPLLRKSLLPGAVLATVGVVLMSTLFSRLIASSARYSLVYGSLASLILLMLWLYLICQAIFVGAALNIALRDRKALHKS